MLDFKLLHRYSFSDIMIINFKMLRTFVNRGFVERQTAERLSHRSNSVTLCSNPIIFNMFCNQATSDAAIYMVRYSASVDDLETVSCLFADHEMIFPPRNVQKSSVDLLASFPITITIAEQVRVSALLDGDTHICSSFNITQHSFKQSKV